MMGDKIIMSAKERKYNEILAQVGKGYMTLVEGSEILSISYRQIKRLWKRYKEGGAAGLVHRNRSKRSSRAKSEEFKLRVLKCYREKYNEFGPTLAAEVLLEEDRLSIHPETLRLWLKGEGLWGLHRRRKSHRRRRQRRERFGELLQIDGSDHAWFGKDKPRCCLLNIVDDATGTTLSQLDKGETLKVLLMTFRKWVKCYGIPQAVYVDLKSLYVSPKRLKSVHEDVKAEDSWSVFERVCQQLRVKIIKAYSPQAKGRVERNHGVYQDRLVKMLALKNITTIKEANVYLEKTFINTLNRKFAKTPQSEENAHRTVTKLADLEQIFCLEYQRQVKNDWTIQWQKQHYQIEKTQPLQVRPKKNVIVRKHLDGKISLWYREHSLAFKPIPARPKSQNIIIKNEYSSAKRSEISKLNKTKTPWSRFNPSWLKDRTKLLAQTTL